MGKVGMQTTGLYSEDSPRSTLALFYHGALSSQTKKLVNSVLILFCQEASSSVGTYLPPDDNLTFFRVPLRRKYLCLGLF